MTNWCHNKLVWCNGDKQEQVEKDSDPKWQSDRVEPLAMEWIRCQTFTKQNTKGWFLMSNWLKGKDRQSEVTSSTTFICHSSIVPNVNSISYKFITCISKNPTETEYFVQNKVQSLQWYFGKISQELKVHCLLSTVYVWNAHTKAIFLIKPSSFALVNIANLHDQLKPIVQCVWKYFAFTLNSRLHVFLLNWLDLPVKIHYMVNVTAPQKGNKTGDNSNVRL